MLKSELIKRISAQNPHLYDRDMALHIKPHEGKAFCAKYRLFVQAIGGRRPAN